MSIEYARLLWHCYLADGIDLKAIPPLEEHEALPRLASPIASAAMVNDEVPAGRLLSNLALSDDEEDWTKLEVVEFDAGEQMKAKNRFCSLKELCRTKRRMIQESVTEAGGLVELVHDTVLVMLPGAIDLADHLVGSSTGQLASASVEVLSLTAKLFNLEKVHDKMS